MKVGFAARTGGLRARGGYFEAFVPSEDGASDQEKRDFSWAPVIVCGRSSGTGVDVCLK